MSEKPDYFEFATEIDLQPRIDEFVNRINRYVDEATLAKVERQLAEYGYVKVTRCCDCDYYEYREHVGRSYCCGEYPTEPDGYCKWGEPREGGE